MQGTPKAPDSRNLDARAAAGAHRDDRDGRIAVGKGKIIQILDQDGSTGARHLPQSIAAAATDKNEFRVGPAPRRRGQKSRSSQAAASRFGA